MTVLLAILLALGVPFAQLHTVNDPVSCCCPNPDQCQCPDHEPNESKQSQMGTCHKSAAKTVRTLLAAFVPPLVVDVIAPAPRSIVMTHVFPAPHASPPPHRLAAPS